MTELTTKQRIVLRNAAIAHPSGVVRSMPETCEQLVKKGLLQKSGADAYQITKAGLELHARIKSGC